MRDIERCAEFDAVIDPSFSLYCSSPQSWDLNRVPEMGARFPNLRPAEDTDACDE